MKSFAAYLVVACLLPTCPVFAQSQSPAPSPTVAAKRPFVAEPAAMALLEKSARKMLSLKTFRATCYETVSFPGQMGKDGKPRPPRYEMGQITAARPNLLRYDAWGMTAPRNDGNFARWKPIKSESNDKVIAKSGLAWVVMGDDFIQKKKATPSSLYVHQNALQGFFTRDAALLGWIEYAQKEGWETEVRLGAPQTVAGEPCDVVDFRTEMRSAESKQVIQQTQQIFIGRDGAMRRKREGLRYSDGSVVARDAIVRDIVRNAPVSPRDKQFVYTPPSGARVSDATKPQPPPVEYKELPLLANGTSAPDFSATGADGKPVKLSDLRGSVVVLDFWASWCPPCVASMPLNHAVAAKLQAEGLPVVVLAVDNAEDRADFLKWVKAHPELSTIRFAYVPESNKISYTKYHVYGIPTQYVIDAGGVIRWSTVGYEENDALENAIRAALAPLQPSPVAPAEGE